MERKRKRRRTKRSDCNTAAFDLRGGQHGVSQIMACHLYDRCVACRISATHAGVFSISGMSLMVETSPRHHPYAFPQAKPLQCQCH
jgi:hypothetical protein